MEERIYDFVNGARIEGRLENVNERKKQIQALHNAVQKSGKRLTEALRKDLDWTETDALLDLSSALQSLKYIFENLDFRASLKAEQQLGCAKKITRHEALGVVLILGDSVVPISQCLVPLCLAIAAGNTAILILPLKILTTSKLLHDVLKNALDSEAIGVLAPTNDSERQTFLSHFATRKFHAVCVQNYDALQEILTFSFFHMSPTMKIAYHQPMPAPVVVTRNADLLKAANDIAETKFTYFSGRSACAPGIILVDEFVVDAFLASLETSVAAIMDKQTSTAINFSGDPGFSNESLKGSDVGDRMMKRGGRVILVKGLNLRLDARMAKILVGTSEWKSFDIFPDFKRHLGDFGYQELTLPIFPTSSMEMAIDLINNFFDIAAPPQAFAFSNPDEGRYLSLFIRAETFFVNSIPVENAISPYPPGRLWQLSSSFQATSLTYGPSRTTTALRRALSSSKGRTVGLKDFLDLQLEPPKQKSGFQVGFFPQGGIVGLGHLLLLSGATTWGIFWVTKYLLQSRS